MYDALFGPSEFVSYEVGVRVPHVDSYVCTQEGAKSRNEQGVKLVLLLRIGFTEQPNDPSFTGFSVLNSGYITVSQTNTAEAVASARANVLFLLMDLSELMRGLICFAQNARTKHWSFSATDAACTIHLDRRKRGMIYLQVNDSEGLYSASDVMAAFQEAIVRFYEAEYTVARRSRQGEGLSDLESDLGRAFRENYQEFLTMQ